LTDEQAMALIEDRKNGDKIKDIMGKYNISKNSVYRYLAERFL
jgi:Mor family transcriptional regulator